MTIITKLPQTTLDYAQKRTESKLHNLNLRICDLEDQKYALASLLETILKEQRRRKEAGG